MLKTIRKAIEDLIMAIKKIPPYELEMEHPEFQLLVYSASALCVIFQIYLVVSYSEHEFHSAYNTD
jgi:hypothetical protein